MFESVHCSLQSARTVRVGLQLQWTVVLAGVWTGREWMDTDILFTFLPTVMIGELRVNRACCFLRLVMIETMQKCTAHCFSMLAMGRCRVR